MLWMRLHGFHMSQTEIDSKLNSAINAIELRCDILRSYQQEAVDQVLKVFTQYARTHIIMACGTGKTRVVLAIADTISLFSKKFPDMVFRIFFVVSKTVFKECFVIFFTNSLPVH
jgi:predicted helicase